MSFVIDYSDKHWIKVEIDIIEVVESDIHENLFFFVVIKNVKPVASGE